MAKQHQYIISGPSGVGKGTMVKKLLARYPEDIMLSISCTTRKKRDGFEKDGIDYHFISPEKFKNMIAQDAFYEYAVSGSGDYYGTPREPAEKAYSEGKSVIYEIENQGGAIIYKRFTDAIRVFVIPTDWKVLIKRLVDRSSETKEQIEKRIRKMPSEFDAAREYQYLLLNDDINLAESDIIAVYEGAYKEPSNLRDILEQLRKDFSDVEYVISYMREYFDEHQKTLVNGGK